MRSLFNTIIKIAKTLSGRWRFIFLALVVAGLLGCGSQPSKSQVGLGSEKPLGAEESAASPALYRSESLEQRLLTQAHDAFKSARYTTPQHDNAYDKFHSVLLLNPENAQARAGLQAILLRYAQLVRSATEKGRLRAASAYLRQAELFYPANALLMDLKKQIKTAYATQNQQQKTVEAVKSPHDEYRLKVEELNATSDTMKALLNEIAQRVKESDESVLIFARSDREGRWIYKQLKLAAEGYRVRGDIRIARAPKVRVLPPL